MPMTNVVRHKIEVKEFSVSDFHSSMYLLI